MRHDHSTILCRRQVHKPSRRPSHPASLGTDTSRLTVNRRAKVQPPTATGALVVDYELQPPQRRAPIACLSPDEPPENAHIVSVSCT